jgi:hypothetical protein
VNVEARPRRERIHWLRVREVRVVGDSQGPPSDRRAYFVETVPEEEVRGVEVRRTR